MARASSSSTSSFASTGSSDEDAAAKPYAASPAAPATIKFLFSYGGKILPRYPDGKLRYVGGDTRLLSVDRSVSLSELQRKMREMCGWSGAVGLRCQLPTEDLDALVSVKSEEDLANVVAEYAIAGRNKIRAFLFPSDASKSSNKRGGGSSGAAVSAAERCVRQIYAPASVARRNGKASAAEDLRYRVYHHLPGHPSPTRPCNHLVHHGCLEAKGTFGSFLPGPSFSGRRTGTLYTPEMHSFWG